MRMYLCPVCGDACYPVYDRGRLAEVIECRNCQAYRNRGECKTVNLYDKVSRSCPGLRGMCSNSRFTVTGFGLDYMTVRGLCGHNTTYGAGSMVPSYPEW
jgi:hypothetical protein